MEIKAFQYFDKKGWTIDKLPQELDSEQTLILVLGSPEYILNQAPLKELSKVFQHSKMMGCRRRVKFLDPNIYDNSLSVVVVKFEHTPIRLVKADVNHSEESFQAGQRITEQLQQDDWRYFCII